MSLPHCRKKTSAFLIFWPLSKVFSCLKLVLLEFRSLFQTWLCWQSHSSPCGVCGSFEAAQRAKGSSAGQVKTWAGLLWDQVTISSRAHSGPWQHPLISQNCFNAVLSGVSMALKCLKLKGLVSASSKKQPTFPKHHPGHLRHPCRSASCDTRPARDLSTCREGGGSRQDS